MFVFRVAGENVRPFIRRVLREDLLDGWEVRGVELRSFTYFEISGLLEEAEENKSNNTGEPDNGESRYRYCLWRDLRPYVDRIIANGGVKPRRLKIVFSLPTERTMDIHPNGAAFFLNFLYEGEDIVFTAASSEKKFSADRSADKAWDDYIKAFAEDWPVSKPEE